MDKKKKSRYPVFGRNLKKLRRAANISQQDLALMIESTQSVISAYESSKAEPNLMTLISIADVLNTTTDVLLGHDTDDAT